MDFDNGGKDRSSFNPETILSAKYHIDFKPEGKPFRLVKYFAVASLLVLIAISFPFALFISQGAKDILVEDFFENYRNAVGENLNNLFSENFTKKIKALYDDQLIKVYKDGNIHLSDPEQQKILDPLMKFAIRGSNIELLKIISVEDKKVGYSTDPKYFGNKVEETPEYEQAVSGKSSSVLLPEGEDGWKILIGKLGGAKKVKAYIPITFTYEPTKEEYVPGVFEIILDMTKQYNAIVKFQYFIFGISLLIMALIFFALLFIVHNAETIIQQRAEEQKRREEQLHQAERLASLGEMVAGVSHEIKNPLGIIQSTAELLSSMNQTDEKQKKFSLVIKEESVRLNNIVSEFLDFARPHELNFQVCHLEEIMQKNISFLGPELEKKGIQVRDNINGRSFKLNGDFERLYRAFMNLFINSIQAINGPGTIDVRIWENQSGYRVEIEDTGGGIDEENIKKIFNPFFTTKERGSGLGLPIVKNIIEGHEGTIDLKNVNGSGVIAVITLPKASMAQPMFYRSPGLT
jgi:two-component system, NtrC family, sensor histidine kinase HydH